MLRRSISYKDWSAAILPKAQSSEADHALSCLQQAQKLSVENRQAQAVWSEAT